MAPVKEPKGVDFIIQSELTAEAREEISAFIKAYKAKKARRTTRSKENGIVRKTTLKL